MLEPLTDLERGILEYLIEYLRHHTYQPSIREIGRRFDIKSTKTVSEHLQSLADKGWVERDPARSRGIHLRGLELAVETISVPLFNVAASESTVTVVPNRELSLDRHFVGAPGAWFLAMPDNSLAEAGIHEGDLLLVEPVALEDLAVDDVVVIDRAGEIGVQYWRGPGVAPAGARALRGRVTALFRRLRDPATLVPAQGAGDIDAPSSIT